MKSRRVVIACLVVVALGAACSNPPSREDQPVSRPRVMVARPNVVVLMLDDVGFGHMSAFGGPIPTPNIDRVAARGLRYTSFHTTALCSPSRAAFLTGRNHHSVGTGKITELASDDPGYTGRIPKSAAMFPQILRENGYETYALGKWHNTPVEDVTPKGPYDLWPQTLGFDHFYGFMGGDTNQWAPNLWDQKQSIDPGANRSDYLLDTDLGDHAVEVVASHADRSKPFFLYIAPGTAHAPHHAPREYIDRNKGKFDQGWDKVREETFARQKEMGIMPETAALAVKPPVIPSWKDLSADEKRLFARMQEVFAGALEYADAQFGRVLDELEKTKQLDDTIVIVTSDNGASGEGGLIGEANHWRQPNGVPESLADTSKQIDKLGGPETFNHYPAGWAFAGNAPGQYWKQTVHEGGVRDPFIISWPARIRARGEIRAQFSHMVDVAPTLFELLGVKMPDEVNGVKQMPLEGKSLVSTLDDARAPTPKEKQYFEMFGNRGIWAGGWKAVAFHGRWPWTRGSNPDFSKDPWELYNLEEDPNETRNIAALEPKKLEELKELFDREAKAHNVYPLDDSTTGLVLKNLKRLLGDKKEFVYQGVTRATPEWLSPPVKNRSHTILARVRVPEGGADGVLATSGGRFGGYALYVKGGRLSFVHNFVGEAKYVIDSSKPVPAGEHELKFVFTKTGENKGHGRLFIDGQLAGQGEIPHTVPILYSATESFDTGLDTGTAAGDYDLPFAYRGELQSVEVTIDDAEPGTKPGAEGGAISDE
jgi:arylsulfatase